MAQPALSVQADLQTARQYLTQGKLADAEQILMRLKAVMAPHPLLQEYLGFIALQRQDHKKAVRHYRKAIKLDRASTALKMKLAEILFSSGEAGEAVQLAQKVRRADPRQVAALNLLGVAAGQDGRMEEALQFLSEAAAVDPASFQSWFNFGRFQLRAGRAQDAVQSLAKADQLCPYHPQTLNLLGRAYTSLGQVDDAIAALEQAQKLASSPQSACETTLHLAEAYWRAQQLDKALAALDVIDKHLPGDPRALSFRATILEQQGHHERALGLIRPLSENQEAVKADWFPHYVEPQCLLSLGRHDEAAAAFEVANQRKAAVHERFGTNKNLFVQYAQDALTAYRQANAQEWPESSDPEAGEGMAFISGFPRSGTTLIDSILRTHSAVAVAEEADAAERCWQEAEELIPGGCANLGEVEGAIADRLRQAYRAALEPALSADITDRCVIDRHATGQIQAGLMKRLFPRAQFFFMLRHPCDAVLSAWFRNFSPTHHTANYLTIDDTARMYDLMMTLSTTLEERIGLQAHIVRYEDLVTDFRGTVGSVLDVLGLEWEDQLESFHQSKNRPKATASFNQISKPIYQSATYRFEHYKPTLEPVMPILQPWIERFGYA